MAWAEWTTKSKQENEFEQPDSQGSGCFVSNPFSDQRMNFSEETFSSWAAAPSKTETDKAKHAEDAVRDAIDADGNLSMLNISVFPQGSYKARTNVRQNSDVDICVRCNEPFFADYPENKTREDFGNQKADLKYADFKNMVQRALVAHFGDASVQRGDKAFDIHENSYRIDADAVATFERRWYTDRKNSDGSHHYFRGVGFLPDSGSRINNWPEQNYDRGCEKNEACNRHYKRVVRIVKRLCYDMAEHNVRAAHNMGSFLIESLVYNVPNPAFSHATYTADVEAVLTHIYNAAAKDDLCGDWREVNGFKFLFHPTQTWTREQIHDFALAAWRYAGF